MVGISFEFFKVGNGDSILISLDNYATNILIDGGEIGTYSSSGLKDRIENKIRTKNKLDLVVLTHYDTDHIGGLIKLLEEEKENVKKGKSTIIKDFWFNTFDKVLDEKLLLIKKKKTAAKEQIKFDTYFKNFLSQSQIETYRPKVSVDEIKKPIFIGNQNEIELVLLSPNNEKLDLLYTKDFEPHLTAKKINKNDYNFSIEELHGKQSAEDGSHRNGSSIAFILIYDNMKFLFLGDAHIGLITESLAKLDTSYFNEDKLIEFEFVKLSHHGSSENIDKKFLDLIKTDKYIISTSGVSHNHPHKEAISKIVLDDKRDKLENGEYKEKIEFFCNYDHKGKVFSVKEQKRYKSPFKLLSRDILNNTIKSTFQKNLEYRLF